MGVLPSLGRLGFASDKPDVVEGGERVGAGANHFRVEVGGSQINAGGEGYDRSDWKNRFALVGPVA